MLVTYLPTQRRGLARQMSGRSPEIVVCTATREPVGLFTRLLYWSFASCIPLYLMYKPASIIPIQAITRLPKDTIDLDGLILGFIHV